MECLLQQAREMTILISSHELGEIDGVATHVAFLDEGRLLFEESMSDLVARFREVHVTLERNGSQNRDELVAAPFPKCWLRSEEHTSELQSLAYLVCRLLLAKINLTENFFLN